MLTLTTVATSLLERVAAPASELGHGRYPTFGPRPGACVCWHSEEEHNAVCVRAGCACGAKFTRPVFGWLTLALAVLRGGK
jgi:hypothetical protein